LQDQAFAWHIQQPTDFSCCGVAEQLTSLENLSAVDLVSQILSNMPNGVVVYRAEEPGDVGSMRVMHVNETAGRLLGIEDLEPFLGQLIADVAPERLDDPTYQVLLQVAQSGTPQNLGNIEVEDTPVGPRIFSVRAFPIPDRSVGVVFDDVTERVEMERRLERQALRYHAIFDATFQFIGLLEPDGTLIEANRTALEFAGLEPEAVIGMPFWECHWWNYSSSIQEQLREAVGRAAAGEFVRYNVQVRGAFDARAIIDFSLKPVYHGDRVVLLIPEGREVTELVNAQRALKRLQKRTERILNAAGEGIMGVDADGVVTFVNQAAAAMLGLPPNELVGKPHHEVLSTVDDAEGSLPLARVLGKDRMRRAGGATVRRDDGTSFPIEYIITPLRREVQTGAVVVFRDISERLEAEAALRESELRHRTVVESLHEGVVLQAADGRILTANPAAERILGLSTSQMEGRTSSDPRWRVIDAEGEPLPGDKHPAMVSLRTGRPIENFVQGVHTPDGDFRWILVNSSPIFSDAREPVAVVATFSDITEQRQAEQLIRESEVRHRTVLSTLNEGVLLVSEDGGVLSANPAAESLLGFLHEDGVNLFDLLDREIIDKAGAPVPSSEIPERLAFRRGQAQRGSVLGIRMSGGWNRWLSINAQPIPAFDESSTRAVVISLADITEQVEAEQDLRASEARLRNAQQLAQIGNWRWDPSTDTITWSEEMYRIYGQDPEAFVPDLHHFLEAIDPEGRETTKAAIENALNTHEPYEVVHQIRRPSGDVRFVQGRGEVVVASDGTVEFLQGTCQDITEQQRARDALQHYAQELEERNTELEQFAYVASHDLQEPLRMVSSFLQLLQRRYGDQLDDTADEYIRFAVDGAKRMQRLIHDLLTYSRVGTRGKSFQKVDMGQIVHEVLTDLQPAIEEAGAVITVQEDLPTVEADPTQVRQLLQNLIGNSIKFRGEQPPQTTISASRTVEGGRAFWRFAIQDNGIGIAPEHAERIFQIFQRLHTRDEYEGTGIGLAICRKIVERHGGSIWLDSEVDRGSTFFFTLPVRRNRSHDAASVA